MANLKSGHWVASKFSTPRRGWVGRVYVPGLAAAKRPGGEALQEEQMGRSGEEAHRIAKCINLINYA